TEELRGSVSEIHFDVIDPRGNPISWSSLPGMRCLESGRPVRDEMLGFRQKDGSITWVSATAEPVIAIGGENPSAVVVSLKPISRMSLGEDPLGKYREWLRWAAHIREVFEFEKDSVKSIRSCMELMARASEAALVAYLGFSGGTRSGLLELRQVWDEEKGFIEDPRDRARLHLGREPYRDWLAVLRMAEVLEISTEEIPEPMRKTLRLYEGDHLVLGFLSPSRNTMDRKQGMIAMVRRSHRGSFHPFELDIFRLILSSIANELIRQNAEAAQKRQVSLFRRLFRVSPLIIAVMELRVDALSIVEVSKTATADTELEESLAGTSDEDLGYSQEVCEMRRAAARRAMKEGRSVRIEYERQKGESSGWEAATFSYLDSHGRSHFFSVAVQDITQEKLEQQQKDQKQNLEAMGRFTSAIAHDLNNLLQPPLIYVQESLDLLADRKGEESDARIEDRLSIALDSLSRSRQLVRRLLAFTRKEPLSPGSTEIFSALEAIINSYRAALPENVALRYRPISGRAFVSLDDSGLEQLVVNLVRNSANALADTGGGIDVRLDAHSEKPGMLRLVVEDDGPGIPESIQAKVFEPFYSGAPDGSGMGLGLSIVQTIVKEASGTIAVESSDGNGTRMIVDLPVMAEPAGPERAGSASLATDLSLEFWVVDDDPLVARALDSGLVRTGQKVKHFADPEEALENLKQGNKPDIIVLDQILGSRKGADYAPRFRRRTDALIIMVSGNPDLTTSEARNLGIDALLTKPVFPDELLAVALDLRTEELRHSI
ncbi:MAG: response regulator, partial [Leptospiraceae bacterium]|nr:response regulator [Leptospiraceae bacterium]